VTSRADVEAAVGVLDNYERMGGEDGE